MGDIQAREQDRFCKAALVSLIGLGSNFLHAALKIGVGTLTGYQALIASGIHSISDLVSDLFAILALRLGSHGADTRFHYGYRKIETVASVLVAALLVFAAIEVVEHAFTHEESGEAITQGWAWILGVTSFGIVTREYLFHYTKRKGIELNSPLLVAKAWHHRTDALSAGAVLVGLIVGFLFPEAEAVDAIATLFVSGFILHGAWEVGSKAVKELIDYAPSLKVVALVEEMADTIPEVTFTHNIRIRTMGGALYVELTAEVSPGISVEEGWGVARKIKQAITDHVENVMDVRVEVTPTGDYLKSNYPELL